MSRKLRYFTNRYPDYDGRLGQVSPEVWKKHALNIWKDIQKNSQTVLRSVDGGLYVGSGGVAFGLMDLASKLQDSASERTALLEFASQLVNANLKYLDHPDFKRDKQMQVGFLLGTSGVQAVAAALSLMKGDADGARMWSERYASVADLCLPVQIHSCGSDELFVGRSGYICGALWLRQRFGHDIVPLPTLHKICDSMLESGRLYSRRKRSPSPLMYSYYDTEYLGAAHGLCAILQMFLSVPDYFRYNKEAERDVKTATNFLMSLQTASGNLPCAMDEAPPHPARKEEDELVHWCHGAPGTVYLFAKAYLVWRDEAYLNAALRCGEVVWQKGLLRKGPGICHGVAGSGFVFLLLFRLTCDPKHLYRAGKFAEFLFTDEFKAARTPDCQFSLYEGTAGTMCFLAALAEPNQSAFPFFDIFQQ